jgi:hypothetical protein
LARRPASDLVEDKSKVTLVAEADFVPDLGDASVSCREQGLCLGDAQMVEIGHEWLSRNSAKEPREMRFAHVDVTRRLLEGNHALQRVVDQFEQRPEALDVVFPAVKRD